MKTFIWLFLFTVFWVSCTEKEPLPNENIDSEIRFKIVDTTGKDFINLYRSPYDTLAFYYTGDENKYFLKYTIHYSDSTGQIIAVKDIPELSSEGKIRFYYMQINSLPIDTLYLDIWKNETAPPTSDSYYNYNEILCNGQVLKFNDHYKFFYIVKISEQ